MILWVFEIFGVFEVLRLRWDSSCSPRKKKTLEAAFLSLGGIFRV